MNDPISPQKRNPVGRSATGSALRCAVGLLVLLAAARVAPIHGEDLPFSSGSTGADGALKVPSHPTFRDNSTMGYDPVLEDLVLFSGNYSNTYYPETYVLNGDEWQLVSTPTFVSARANSAMAWDGNNEKLIMFGGYRADGVYLNDMWTWEGDDWQAMNVANRPPARYQHSMVTDPTTGDIYLFGGRAAAVLNDVWKWDGTSWTDLTATAGTAPRNDSTPYLVGAWDISGGFLLAYNGYSRETWRLVDGVWTKLSTSAQPPHSYQSPTLVTDVSRGSAVLFGGSGNSGQTWEFKNGDWQQVTTDSVPNRRYEHAAAYHSGENALYISLGIKDGVNGGYGGRNYDTWKLIDGDWEFVAGRFYTYDMSARESGIWNYTTIDVPANVEVLFKKNSSNTPVVWLATGAVNIDGYLHLDGQDAKGNDGSDSYALGGPGGAAGGLGGIRFDVSGSYAGTPGQGAGGGAPGVTASQYGEAGHFNGTYGNTLLLPLVGGSGGGGGASSNSANGGHGGGGGGAILIASDLDITVDGVINADGGNYTWGGASYGGRGSGGAIKLMADRILGNGNLYARGGGSQTNTEAGRIRMEAFYRPLASRTSPLGTTSAPIAAPDFSELPTLSIVSVDGANVRQPPTGNLQTPDVVFVAEGTVNIVVDSENIPVGTPVTLRITSSGEIINLPADGSPDVTVGADGMATFSTTVPAGTGTVQAFSEFTP